jgi:hypothetical protein
MRTGSPASKARTACAAAPLRWRRIVITSQVIFDPIAAAADGRKNTT